MKNLFRDRRISVEDHEDPSTDETTETTDAGEIQYVSPQEAEEAEEIVEDALAEAEDSGDEQRVEDIDEANAQLEEDALATENLIEIAKYAVANNETTSSLAAALESHIEGLKRRYGEEAISVECTSLETWGLDEHQQYVETAIASLEGIRQIFTRIGDVFDSDFRRIAKTWSQRLQNGAIYGNIMKTIDSNLDALSKAPDTKELKVNYRDFSIGGKGLTSIAGAIKTHSKTIVDITDTLIGGLVDNASKQFDALKLVNRSTSNEDMTKALNAAGKIKAPSSLCKSEWGTGNGILGGFGVSAKGVVNGSPLTKNYWDNWRGINIWVAREKVATGRGKVTLQKKDMIAGLKELREHCSKMQSHGNKIFNQLNTIKWNKLPEPVANLDQVTDKNLMKAARSMRSSFRHDRKFLIGFPMMVQRDLMEIRAMLSVTGRYAGIWQNIRNSITSQNHHGI